MFHAKCKARITYLEQEIEHLVTASRSQDKQLADLESKLKLAEVRLAESDFCLKQARAELVQFGDACQAIAGSACCHVPQVRDALARVPGQFVSDANLSTIKIILVMRYYNSGHIVVFNMIVMSLKQRLLEQLGSNILPGDLTVDCNKMELRARYRGDFMDICNQILGIVVTPYLGLKPVINVSSGLEGALTVLYDPWS